jgi:hypothetical protein
MEGLSQGGTRVPARSAHKIFKVVGLLLRTTILCQPALSRAAPRPLCTKEKYLPAPNAKVVYETAFFFGGAVGSMGVVSTMATMIRCGKRKVVCVGWLSIR